MDAAEAFRDQAEACAALGSPMYAGLLARLAEDIEAGGPTAAALLGHEDDPARSALALRLLGSVHRLVLQRRAGPLATYYPSVGGTWQEEQGTAAVLGLLDLEAELVRAWLDRPPQTNEVGRATALFGALLHLDAEERLPVRLFEIGASGGLNLLADRFAYVDTDGRVFGVAGSPVRLDPAWSGQAPTPWPDLRVVERMGCDLMPVDVSTTEGRLALTAYVWPDQVHRLERLRGALALAERTKPVVERWGAGEFVERLELRDGTTTVVWHSVMWQYLLTHEQARVTAGIERLGAQATGDARFAHVWLEPETLRERRGHRYPVRMTTWPGGETNTLGWTAPHGVPVSWGAAAAGPWG